jgi:hypothetical protein
MKQFCEMVIVCLLLISCNKQNELLNGNFSVNGYNFNLYKKMVYNIRP